MAKKKEAKPRPEKYEKSNLAINGGFDEAMKVFFIKPKQGEQLAKKISDSGKDFHKVDNPIKKHGKGDQLKSLKEKRTL
ncbi:MAG: hypothetical protein JWP94_1520 [Mucilaginibacter sp.]|nr:hypothetical protein [Mucilaginibacter sp.]